MLSGRAWLELPNTKVLDITFNLPPNDPKPETGVNDRSVFAEKHQFEVEHPARYSTSH